MKKLLLLLFFFLIIPIKMNGLEYNTDSIIGYGGSSFDTIFGSFKTSDNKIMMFGNTFGNTPDHTKFGNTNGIIVLFNGQEKYWTKGIKSTESTGNVQIFRGIETNDGYVFLGSFDKPIKTELGTLTSNGETDLLILKYSKNGTLLWQQSYGGNNYEGSSNEIDLDILPDNNIIVGLSSESQSITINGNNTINNNNLDIILLNINSTNGYINNQRKLNLNNENSLSDIKVINDEKIIISGSTNSTNMGINLVGQNDCFILELNNDLTINWATNIGVNGGTTAPNDLLKTSDGNYVLVGATDIGGLMEIETNNTNNSGDGWIFKVSNSGQKCFYKLFSSSINSNLMSVMEDRNNNYIVTGQTNNIDSFILNNQEIPLYTYSRDNGKILSKQIIIPTKNSSDDKTDIGYFLMDIDKMNGNIALGLLSMSNWSNPDYTNNGNTDMLILNLKEKTYKKNINKSTNGIISLLKDEYMENEKVLLNINPKIGYEIDEINIINDSTNEEIEVTNNEFIMPKSSVTINATFKKVIENPKTEDNIFKYIIIMLISIIYLLKFIKKQKNLFI